MTQPTDITLSNDDIVPGDAGAHVFVGKGSITMTAPTVHLRWKNGVLEQMWQITNLGGGGLTIEWRPVPIEE